MEELNQLKDLVAQLQAENRLLREQDAAPGTSAASNDSAAPPPPSSAPVVERLFYVPRDRKCPMFRGRTGFSINEWAEEIQACMRARHLSRADQAQFVYDHLESEAREEIKYRSLEERGDPEKILAILRELYGCSKSYISLQEDFFSRKQQDDETLQEFSHALMCLMDKVVTNAPNGFPNSHMLMRDQFVEHVCDCALRRELRQFVRRHPEATLLEVRSEAIRWEREGMPGGARGRSHSVSSAAGFQFAVAGGPHSGSSNLDTRSELAELKQMLKRQQEQLNELIGKLSPPELLSQSSGGGPVGSEQDTENPDVVELMAACPHLTISMGGVAVPCLVDTGSMSFFIQNFEPWGDEKLRSCHWLQLKAANGLDIPYVGYLELDVELCDKVIKKRGVLVVKDPIGQPSSVPGVLGMNIIKSCYAELFVLHGSALFDLPSVSQAPSQLQIALQQCHQAQAAAPPDRLSRVKVKGGRVFRVPGGTTKLVAATCSQHYSSDVLFEPLSTGLPAGLLVSPALVQLSRGTVYIPIVNVGVNDAVLYPHTVIGTVSHAHVVSLPTGVTEGEGQVSATMSSQMVTNTIQEKTNAIDLSALSETEQSQVRSLLQKHSDVFSAHEGDLGCTNLISHDIPLLDETPVRQRYRRIPPSEYETVKAHIHQLLEAKVIRESSSPFASPIVLVKKKDGTLRLCVDYRLINSKTRRDAFPLPRIEESLDALSGARWFSTLDLASGYNQVPVAEKDKMKTAFCTPFGLFEWNRMPFGLCNAPSTFQRLMERIFGAQHCQSLLLYLDDVIVFSSSVAQHMERLNAVLERLKQENLKAKLEKCCFFKEEVGYLGHVISKEGVATDPRKIDVVTKWQRPTNVTELQSFLGFASYYRRFVNGFAKLAAPLHRLAAELRNTKTRRQVAQRLGAAWTEECEQCFEGLKRKLVEAPVLAYANFSLPFVLEVDASHSGLGAVLSQEQEGKVKPIAYASRGLKPAERNMNNYSSMKLEFLALKWAMTEKFREYLLGQKCVVYTDNNPLSHLSTAKLGAVEQRWASELANFDYVIKYRPGKRNGNADALSRQYVPSTSTTDHLARGTPLPESMQQACRAVPEVKQNAISAFPCHSLANLRALQEADATIHHFLGFWIRKRGPDAGERRQMSKEALTLVRQWDRIVEEDGVLH
ncbi:Retrovirus-related Pol polyprotein from transposon 17.6 [Merluccius polli]|uniref:ribonuclease H n=1 Tax=Merluccius polli TaxID=89951 RepID=A0AA47M8X3_MERPO|nr:Retrovirus-related Pol polyprotein from transposon 17.6 [Merluccius polli]